ncbi:MAG: PIN domain-containing protein [Kiritimatiellia bacterium]|nr:PIN domain-containing protein [Kiritimatiellia bacterium]
MTAAVFDTNVILSGVLSPGGAPGRLLDALLDGVCRPVVNDSILVEYEDVLSRPKFGFPAFRIHVLMDAIRGRAVFAPFAAIKLKRALPDPEDLPFMEAALGHGVPIVTGNIRHFPRELMGSIPVFSPAEFLARLYVSHRVLDRPGSLR